jgi:hypothetical protein
VASGEVEFKSGVMESWSGGLEMIFFAISVFFRGNSKGLKSLWDFVACVEEIVVGVEDRA